MFYSVSSEHGIINSYKPQSVYTRYINLWKYLVSLAKQNISRSCRTNWTKGDHLEWQMVGKLPARQGGKIKQRINLQSLCSRKRPKTDPPPLRSMGLYLDVPKRRQTVWENSCIIGRIQ